MKAKKWICLLMAASLIGLDLPVQTVQAQDTKVEETGDSDSDSDFKITYDGELQQYTGTGGDIEIPEGVTSIGEDAFRNCKKLTKITIPEAITSIDKEAFYGHSSSFIIYGKSGSYAKIYARERAIPFQSTGQSTKDISQCSAVLSQVSYTYDGTAKTPAVTVKDGKVTLTENLDYQVSYGNNTSVGKTQVFITGIVKHRGTDLSSCISG